MRLDAPFKNSTFIEVDNVIREGEKSGNKHEIGGQSKLFAPEGNKEADIGMVLKVGPQGAEITHPEHETIKLPEGDYRVLTQREYDEQKHRKAKD